MNPGDIQLAPERPKPQTPPKESAPKVALPISFEDFKRVEGANQYTKFEGVRVFGVTVGITDFSDIPLYYYTNCVRFDLQDPKARQQYADLVSETLAPDSPITVLWDDRVIDGSSMIMYITYSEKIRIVGLEK